MKFDKDDLKRVEDIGSALDIKRGLRKGWGTERISNQLGVDDELVMEVEEGKFWWLQDVLDKGYVRLLDWTGDEMTVVNAARASFAKEVQELGSNDVRLIKYLGENGHFSVFRHNFISFEIKAPLEVTRQWWKYVMGSAHTDSFSTAWNEASRRYLTMDPEFYIPDVWRTAPDDKKQGSGGPTTPGTSAELSQELETYAQEGASIYWWAINDLGIAPEMARLFLPAYGMYTTWRWSTSLQGVAFFLSQRIEEGAQSEIQKYAWAVLSMVEPLYPTALSALMKGCGVDLSREES